MSLHNAAKYLESKGRNGDSVLVHMTPGEVRGLQALALAQGGSLSINPDTGLVEANFLKRMLPMVAGAALTGLSGGAINPLTASMLVGGFEGVRTGDLGRGLMAGLGAYGGAGLTQGLSTAGAQSLGTTGAQVTPTATENVGANILKENVGLGGTTSIPTSNAAAETLRSTAPAPVTGANIRAGIGQLGSEAGRSAVYQALPTMTVPTTGMAIANAATPEVSVPGPIGPDEYDRRLAGFRLSPNFQGYTPPQPNPYYTPRGLGYAEGGDVMLARGGDFDDQPGETAFMASGGIASYANEGQVRHLPRDPGVSVGIFRDTDPDTARKDALEAALVLNKKAAAAAALRDMGKLPKTNITGLGDIKAVAEGGSIGGYSDGGRMLKGPGDGMSDSIPATIGKRQPARLADGEFVVPADVVSHLGNGSTDAGARKLYSMMDKVRKARTGKKKQAPAVNADKYMPA